MAAEDQAADSSAQVLAEVKSMIANDAQVQAELARQGVSPETAFGAARQVLAERPFDAEATLREFGAAQTQLRTPWYVNVLIALAGLGVFGLLVLLVVGIAKWTGHLLALPIWPFVAASSVLLACSIPGYILDPTTDTGERTRQEVERRGVQAKFYERLRSLVVLPAIERATKVRFVAPSADFVLVTDAPSLASRIVADRRIETESYRLVLTALSRPGGTTIGLAGTRGAGKSELLRAFCDDATDKATVQEGGTIGVIIPAPVAYGADSFLRVLVRRLAEEVPEYNARLVGRPRQPASLWESASVLAALACIAAGLWLIVKPDQTSKLVVGSLLLVLACVLTSAVIVARTPLLRIARNAFANFREPQQLATARRIGLARIATRVVERVLYTETRTASSQASASWRGVGLQQGSGVSLGQLPLTEADLVAALDDFVRQLNDGGYTVRIGIDELDKLADSDAKNFLTGLKVLFTIRDCSFILTISEDASAQFARRGMAIRDVFDSSLDSVTIVQALTYPESRRLVQTRGAATETDQISDTQVLLCFLLSGGLPRDLLRYCRQLGELNSGLGGNRPLSEVMASLLQSERAARIKAIELELRGRDEAAGPEFMLELETIAQTVQGPEWLATFVDFLGFDSEFSQIASARELARIGQLRESRTAPHENWIRDTRRQLMCYLFFAHTVFDVMIGLKTDGQTGREYNTSALAKFELLADAERRMELDPAAGWRRIVQARREFGLVPESPATPHHEHDATNSEGPGTVADANGNTVVTAPGGSAADTM